MSGGHTGSTELGSTGSTSLRGLSFFYRIQQQVLEASVLGLIET